MMDAYLVLGAESSGTRMMTRLLMESGCLGTDRHDQYWDDLNFPEPEQDIVFRRSMPHAKEWADITNIIGKLRGNGYVVTVIVTTRDWYSMIESQIAAKHVNNRVDSISNIQQAYELILESCHISSVPYVMVSYESIVGNPESINKIMKMIGRKTFSEEQIKKLNIYNGNKKWYKD